MRIGVDACCWSNRRGFGRFTRELLRAMVRSDAANDYVFFVDKSTADECTLPEEVETIVVSTRAAPTDAASAAGRRSLEDVLAFSREVLKHDLQLFFFPAVYSYFPVFNRAKIIVTLHDVIAERHPDLVFPNSRLQFYWNLKRKIALRQADLILTVSENSKRELVTFLGLPERRIRSISEAADPVFTVLPRNGEMQEMLRRYKIEPSTRFLLYVGGISPHKNLDALIAAFRELSTDPCFADLKLVLVGDYRDDPFLSAYHSLKRQIRSAALEDRVIFTGFVPDQDLALLYNAAALFVLPSLEEGFGLPVIEAMACGAPVVSSDRGSLPEVLGDAGRFFDPQDTGMLTGILKQVLTDDALRTEMRSKGLQRTPQFTWAKAANDTLAVFEEARRL